MVRIPLLVILFAPVVAAFGTSADDCQATSTSVSGGFCVYCDRENYENYEQCYVAYENAEITDLTLSASSADDCYDYCSARHSDLVCWEYKKEDDTYWSQEQNEDVTIYYDKCCCVTQGDATFPDDFGFYQNYDDDDAASGALEALPLGVVTGANGTCITLPSPDELSCLSDCCFGSFMEDDDGDDDNDDLFTGDCSMDAVCTMLKEGTDDCLSDCDACDIDSVYNFFDFEYGCDGSRRLSSKILSKSKFVRNN